MSDVECARLRQVTGPLRFPSHFGSRLVTCSIENTSAWTHLQYTAHFSCLARLLMVVHVEWWVELFGTSVSFVLK